MKSLKFTIAVLAIFTLISCGGSTSKQAANAEGFAAIEAELKSKFGDDAYFTKISITYDKSIGNMISVTATEDPESMKMGEWTLAQNNWNQTSELTLEVPEGTKAADFMYQLDEKINLTKLGELVEKSSQQLKDEKNLKNPTLYNAYINFPRRGGVSKMEYSINLKPENGGTTFSFYYKLDGELRKMDY